MLCMQIIYWLRFKFIIDTALSGVYLFSSDVNMNAIDSLSCMFSYMF